MTARVYPLAALGGDPRFTFGLTYDVAKVIEAAGYPAIGGVDFVGLQSALYKFLYADRVLADARAEEDRIAAELDASRPKHRPERLNADIVVCVCCTEAMGARILWPCLAFSAADIAADFAATPALDDVHAMMPDRTGGSPRCGAVGRVALFARNVSCSRCLAMLAEQARDGADDDTDGEAR